MFSMQVTLHYAFPSASEVFEIFPFTFSHVKFALHTGRIRSFVKTTNNVHSAIFVISVELKTKQITRTFNYILYN